jgi:hypothetical protein
MEHSRTFNTCSKDETHFREALEISLKNVGRSDIKKEKDRDLYRTKVFTL